MLHGNNFFVLNFSLECGFVSWHGGGRVSAVDSVDLELAYHGEGGRMPNNYGFNFTAGQIKIIIF